MEQEVNGARVCAVDEVNSARYEAVVLVTGVGARVPQALEDFVLAAAQHDHALLAGGPAVLVRCPRVSGARLVLAPTGPLSHYHDVRSVGEAMLTGVRRAAAAGARRVVVLLGAHERFPRAPLVALLAALEATYTPIQLREWEGSEFVPALEALGVYEEGLGEGESLASLIHEAAALERARALCRDVAGADPERMTAARAAQYIAAAFPLTPPTTPLPAPRAARVTVRVLSDLPTIEREYPLFAAVNRCANTVPRHRGCIVFLEYCGEQHERTVMLVGKGVTYDTGGCDLKTGGAMAGMSCDKSGAAAVAGFFKACEELQPRIKALGALALLRNSVGADAYVADELLRARTGVPVRVGNTDAEGRLAMADLLAEMRERAASEKQPHILSIATLTGHAVRAMGPGYSALLDNHAARGAATALAVRGEALGEAGEVSRVRREDLREHMRAGGALHQAASMPSSSMPRGHQAPAAFLMLASGLDSGDVPYTHIDIAASAGILPGPPTGVPILTLANYFGLLKQK